MIGKRVFSILILVFSCLLFSSGSPNTAGPSSDASKLGPPGTAPAEFDFLDEGNVNVRVITCVVNSSLYPSIRARFETYYQDLVREGYRVLVHARTSALTAPELRNLLAADRRDYRIEGAFLVGNLPYALYEEGPGNPFPYAIDYYFMDLTGAWADADGDGWFDGHTDPDHAPEIYIGRLRADNMGEPEASLVNEYFRRNHEYRTAGSTLPRRAVNFSSDLNRAQRLEALYGADRVADHTDLSGEEFLRVLGTESGEVCHVLAHSTACYHIFLEPNGQISSVAVAGVRKAYHFFLLHCCSVGDFTTPLNLAFTYLLRNSEGLAVFAVTKSAGANYFDNYFAANFMAMDMSVGMALLRFDTLYMPDDILISDEGEFHLLGDPTLRFAATAGAAPAASGTRTFVWNEFNNDYQYSPATLAQYGGYYDLHYFNPMGGWPQWWDSNERSFGDYGDDIHTTLTANDSCLFTFDGSAVEFYFETHPNHGLMDVYVDFVFQGTVDPRAPRAGNTLAFSFQWPRNGRHTLMIVNKNEGQWGVVDYFRVRRDR